MTGTLMAQGDQEAFKNTYHLHVDCGELGADAIERMAGDPQNPPIKQDQVENITIQGKDGQCFTVQNFELVDWCWIGYKEIIKNGKKRLVGRVRGSASGSVTVVEKKVVNPEPKENDRWGGGWGQMVGGCALCTS
ncbi:MAG: hypothetical protein R8J85_09225, partial [Mariprofundales bacterium]